eukprot:CAMPEP_0194399758 /NCGR_PEP_ID=MMETSP0174-20130528/126833_1 /TAXON_ID=216777 /ORGANISM="Proboscia alata, Strain PI-D3" /LENGTH=134 /DNA_ID=CAMNT_0039196193 /DNA_START=51 /DNA_END=452 /DNA_ORIENTATION=+
MRAAQYSRCFHLLSEPHKVRQNDFSPGRGNALQAVVASVFGLDLQDVPNFITMEGGYENAIRTFCREKGDVDCKKMAVNGDLSEYEGKLCILRGTSPRGDFGHVVVARRKGDQFEMVHDPHPDETFLTGDEFGW